MKWNVLKNIDFSSFSHFFPYEDLFAFSYTDHWFYSCSDHRCHSNTFSCLVHRSAYCFAGAALAALKYYNIIVTLLKRRRNFLFSSDEFKGESAGGSEHGTFLIKKINVVGTFISVIIFIFKGPFFK